MKKVITFCLWGDKPIYNIGAVRNCIDAAIIYPGFECWVYVHTDSVPEYTIQELNKLPNTKVIHRSGDINTCKPMMWRFEAIDEPDVEIMMSRDTDTRILPREVAAVNVWLQSDKPFHIMRDHIYHCVDILGGMFGTKKNPEIPSWKELMKNVTQNSHRDYDQIFLKDYIYNIVKDISIVHDQMGFPIPYDEYFNFVGQYVNEHGITVYEHRRMLADKYHLPIKK